MRTWLLVADGVRGRLFKVDRKAKKLVEVADLLNPEGRLHEKEFYSDAPGKTYDREGQGRHFIEEGEKKKEQSKEQFAHRLVMYLDEKYKTEKINHLFVVAPSKLLGHLNREFNKLHFDYKVTKIAKEISSLSSTEIFKILEKDLLTHTVV